MYFTSNMENILFTPTTEDAIIKHKRSLKDVLFGKFDDNNKLINHYDFNPDVTSFYHEILSTKSEWEKDLFGIYMIKSYSDLKEIYKSDGKTPLSSEEKQRFEGKNQGDYLGSFLAEGDITSLLLIPSIDEKGAL